MVLNATVPVLEDTFEYVYSHHDEILEMDNTINNIRHSVVGLYFNKMEITITIIFALLSTLSLLLSIFTKEAWLETKGEDKLFVIKQSPWLLCVDGPGVRNYSTPEGCMTIDDWGAGPNYGVYTNKYPRPTVIELENFLKDFAKAISEIYNNCKTVIF